MLKKAIITIKGDIQEAGYRAKIMKIAQKLNLEGIVENLPTGEVVITCEGKEDVIKKLVKEINIKNEITNVEEINEKYGDYKGDFKDKGFTVKITDANYEMFQGSATAGKYFGVMFDKQDKMLEKQDKMLEKQDDTIKAIKEVKEEIKEVKVEVIERYGSFSEDMKELKGEMRGLRGEIKEMKDLFADFVHYFIERDKGDRNAKKT